MASTTELVIDRLEGEYSKGIYGGNCCNLFAGGSIIYNGFIGSHYVVFLTSMDSIIHEAPACIAARLVNMVAKESISLGIAGQGSQPVPVRLYAPEQVTITTKHLSIGDITLLTEPEHGFISCKRLTLSKAQEEDPDYFEIVKSWVIDDETEVETILRHN